MKRINQKLCLLTVVALLILVTNSITTHAAEQQQQTFSIAIIKNDTLVYEKQYSLEELAGLPQTRQLYTSMNDDFSPEVILTEGILLSDLLKNLGLKQEDLKSLRIYSSEGWNRGFTSKFLVGSTRYAYPTLMNDPGQEVDIRKQKEGAVEVTPMLALKSFQNLATGGEDWSKLNSNDGIRICYGQLTPSDICSTLYGSNLNRIEFNLNEKSSYGLAAGEQAPQIEDGVVVTVDRYNDKKILGPVTDQDTNVTIDKVPSELTIRLGYFGHEFQLLKTLTIDDLKKLPIVKQAYTIRKGKQLIVETVMGVRVSDLLASLGIYQDQVKYFYFYTADSGEATKLEISKKSLMDVMRYYYPKLPLRWDSSKGTPQSGAAVHPIPVDPVLAFRDHWDVGATAPDFYSMNGNDRFGLVMGQMTTTEENGAQSAKWIHTIDVMLSGAPPDMGKNGTGAAGISISKGGKKPVANSEQTTAVKPSEKQDSQEMAMQGDTAKSDGSLRSWHLYEVTNPESTSVQRNDETFIRLMLLSIILFVAVTGATRRYWQYKI